MLEKQRKLAFRKILHEFSKKVTAEELEECFKNVAPKKWGWAYRDLNSDWDMHITFRVEFAKVNKEERVMEILEAEKRGETTYLNLEKEFGE